MARVFEAEGDYQGMFNMDYECRWLIVPMFSIAELTCEVIVQSHLQFHNSNQCHKHDKTTVIRMLRSNSTGDILLALNDEDENMVGLHLFCSRTRARRKRVFLRAERDAFLKALAAPSGINFPGIYHALVLAKENLQFLDCPLCTRRSPGSVCSCEFDFKRPAHPLDFSTCRTNLMYHDGRFSGGCNMSLLTNGVPFARAGLLSTVSIHASCELGMVKRLAESGVRSNIASNAVVPRLVPTETLDEHAAMSFPPSGAFCGTSKNASFFLEGLMGVSRWGLCLMMDRLSCLFQQLKARLRKVRMEVS